jgi:thymidine kinase
MSGRLELIIGPMFSGKSTHLIRKIRLAKIINKKVLVIKPLIDNRYIENKIVSHSFESEECCTVELLSELHNKINEYDLIIIDEGQFFKDLKDAVVEWVEKCKKEVIVGGLDGDFKRNPIGQILELIPYSDKCKKISSLCRYCNNGNSAYFSHKLINNNEQVQIGGAELYTSLCRHHYWQFNNNLNNNLNNELNNNL